MSTINYCAMTDEEVLATCEGERVKCEVWTRVMGYFRPYSQYNKGKKSEFNERAWFTEEHAIQHMNKPITTNAIADAESCSCEIQRVA